MKNNLLILLFAFTLVFAFSFTPNSTTKNPTQTLMETLANPMHATALKTDIQAYIKQKNRGGETYKPSPETLVTIIKTYKNSRDYNRIKIYEAFIEYEKQNDIWLNDPENQSTNYFDMINSIHIELSEALKHQESTKEIFETLFENQKTVY